MKNKIRQALLKVRDWSILQRHCLGILAKHNLGSDEILSCDFDDGYPRISIKNGPVLCAFDDLRIGPIFNTDFPESHTGCLAAYILRYRYPHGMPNLVIDTGIIPRKLFPAVIHRQHLNTLHDLNEKHRKEFMDAIPARPGDHVLEIGSYMGYGTVHLSEVVGATGRVHSIEADHDAYELLKKNVSNNLLDNVHTESFAVGGKDTDSATFYKSERQANSLHQDIIGESRERTIRVKSLETVLNALDFEPTCIILTINGSEYEALNSAFDFLSRNKNLRIVVPGWYRDGQGRLGERIIKLLQDANFRVAYTAGMHIFAYKPQ